MQKILVILMILPAMGQACTQHDSYDTWYKHGLIKQQKDGSLTCDAARLGVKNCAEALPYIYHKLKKKKGYHDQFKHTH
jgi:hypothetical protein